MSGLCRMIVGMLIVLSATAAVVDPGDEAQKVKSKHKRMVEEAEFFYSVDDHFMSSRIYGDLVELYPENGEFNFRLGFSFLHLRNEEKKAIPFLEKAVETGYTPAFYFLAEGYHLDGRFDEAIEMLEKYRQCKDHQLSHSRIDIAVERSVRAKEMLASPERAVVNKLGTNVNSDFQDYAPNIDPEGHKLFFTSRRPGSTGGNQDAEGGFFEDVYVARQLAGAWTIANGVSGPVNSEGHDANVNLTSSGNRLIIYRTHKSLESGDLYYSDFRRDGWTEPMPFGSSINTEKYHEPSAAFSPDERVMYLASDRPGGYGGKDLYTIRLLPNGDWSEPENMGKAINSPFDEDAPFISVDGRTMYFSSTGHTSIGGYDIFRSRMDRHGDWSEPHQLGYPINSVADDIYFSTTANGKKAYFSSSRDKSMDIYEVDMLFETEDLVVMTGFVTEEGSGLPISAQVTVSDRNGVIPDITTITNNQSGKYVVALMPGKKYRVMVQAIGFEAREENIDVEVASKGVFRKLERDVVLELGK